MSANYLLNSQRIKYIHSVSEEYLSILAILYGDTLESGIQRISGYGSMTMLEAENELRLRTLMYKGRRIRRQRDLRSEHEENEKAMLEQLKRLS